jgi:hypothetical protein
MQKMTSGILTCHSNPSADDLPFPSPAYLETEISQDALSHGGHCAAMPRVRHKRDRPRAPFHQLFALFANSFDLLSRLPPLSSGSAQYFQGCNVGARTLAIRFDVVQSWEPSPPFPLHGCSSAPAGDCPSAPSPHVCKRKRGEQISSGGSMQNGKLSEKGVSIRVATLGLGIPSGWICSFTKARRDAAAICM